ncbi:MAG: ectonucleotide pyrophosphatase/phosphodiesterase [Gemmatimonadales bacterium]
MPRRSGWLLLLLVLAACGREPIVVLVGIDGFRHDYLKRPQAVALQRLRDRGVAAERLLPAFPSKTFPNFYTLATGLYPAHHGIIANNMRDPVLGRFSLSDRASVEDGRWWGGEPIWVTAIRQGRHAEALFWPGSEAPVGGIYPERWRRFDAAVGYGDRVRAVLEAISRPGPEHASFAALYLEGVDAAGHRFGPTSPQVDSAIARADSAVALLVAGIDSLGLEDRVNVIVVSDHGMAELAPERVIYLDDYLPGGAAEITDLNPVAALVPAEGRDAEVLAALTDRHPHLHVYRAGAIPERLHYRDSPRIAPVVAMADPGWTISLRARGAPTDRGNHGFDPEDPDLGGVFVAAGPAFRNGAGLPAVRNVQIYELICRILGLEPAPNDGHRDSLAAALKRK